MDVWDGSTNQVNIFAANAQITYPLLMLGGQAGLLTSYNCTYDYFFVIGGDGIIKWRGQWSQTAITAAIDGAVAELGTSAVSDLPGTGHQLLANYPNPFNPQTMIPYELAAGGAIEVQLDILDVRGRLVQTLVQSTQTGGQRYEAAWDGNDRQGQRAPSGTYLARLVVAGETRTRLLTLVK